MIQGHGDDRYRFQREIRADFSSNVYAHVDLKDLLSHLGKRLEVVGRYPEPEPYTLEKALAAQLGIDPAAVCVTAGATEAIYLTAHAFAGSNSTILQPTFSEYADACRLYRHTIYDERTMRCPVKPGMTKGEPGGTIVWLCNPNNPTGKVVLKEQMTKAVKANPETIFVIDQSYGFFTQAPLLSAAEAAGYPNVIQLHSMTKRYAMPGIRLGYVTAHPALIERIRAVRMPWSVNAIAIEAGLYLTRHPDTAPIDLKALLTETQRLLDQLNTVPGLTAEPTQTHFFLCRLAKGRASELKQRLVEEYAILIRDASNFEGLDEHCFRIATQTHEENDRLVEAIQTILKDNG